ncbi:MAG: hypothetical protein OEV91_06645 [Desulfobulbaceae bacterium]|nr:hypothetical protein [Desulfobulbaceae bacterium]
MIDGNDDDQGRLYRIPNRESTANTVVGAVDLGSNTFRLLIGRMDGSRVIPLVREMVPVRLGEGLGRTGRIGDPALARAREVLAGFRALIDHHRPRAVRACGTAALRLAANREQLAAEAAAILDCRVEVIDGAEEARLSVAGAVAAMRDPAPGPMWLADVGGGSTELILAQRTSEPQPAIMALHSVAMGAVNLTEGFLKAERPTRDELAALTSHVEATLAPLLRAASPAGRLVGMGGTATALAGLDCGLALYDPDRIQDHVLSAMRLDTLLARLAGLTAAQRNLLPGLDRGRGEIIIGGLLIFRALLKRLGFTQMQVSDGGLPEGILLAAADENRAN